MGNVETVFLQAVRDGLQRCVIENPGLSQDEWKALLNISLEQSLLPVVFEAVYAFLPEDLEREYRIYAIEYIRKQMRSTRKFLEVYKKLISSGFSPLVVKGIVCRDAYMLSDWRISSDEDIYINKDEYQSFHDLMKQLGFKCREPNYDSEHELLYYKDGMHIEGHWELFPKENRLWQHMNELSEEIIGRARYLDIEKTPILAPEPTDHMIYLLLHAMKHFSLAGVGIRQICDIVQWNKKYKVDWNRIRTTMEQFGGIHFTEALLDAGHRYFDMPIPDGWDLKDSSHLIEDALKGGVFGSSTKERLHSAAFTSVDGIGHHFAYDLLRSIFPSRKVMEINYPWVSKSRALLPLGWSVRLIKYAANIGKGNSPIKSIQIGSSRVKLLKEYDVFQ